MPDILLDPNTWASLLTLTALEIVLGIDNIIFISIMAAKLPPHQQKTARQVGLALALLTRLALLASIAWVATLTEPLLSLGGLTLSGRDLILIGGGLFLVWKSTQEVHQLMEGEEGEASSAVKATFGAVIVQIIMIDIVFSLDSIITAIGMVNNLPVMMAAVIASVGLMMIASGPISDFVSRHPTVKMLALSFLLVIGVVLMADAFGHHVPKGYIYSAMAFSVMVEMLNLRMRARAVARVEPVKLHEPYVREGKQ